MSVPASITTANGLSAKWVMNAKLSTPYEDVLSVQGVGFMKRKAITLATVTVNNTVSTNAAGVTEIESKSSASGIPGAQEHIIADGQEHKSNHEIYGQIITKARWVSVDEAKAVDAGLVDLIVAESTDPATGKILLIESWADESAGNKTGWHAHLTSGFKTVDGERRWVRINSFKSKKVNKLVVLVYDYKETI